MNLLTNINLKQLDEDKQYPTNLGIFKKDDTKLVFVNNNGINLNTFQITESKFMLTDCIIDNILVKGKTALLYLSDKPNISQHLYLFHEEIFYTSGTTKINMGKVVNVSLNKGKLLKKGSLNKEVKYYLVEDGSILEIQTTEGYKFKLKDFGIITVPKQYKA